MKNKTVFLYTICCCFCILSFNCKGDQNNTSIKSADIKFKKEGLLKLKKKPNDSVYKTVDIEIADDEYQRQTGLMYRNSLEQDHGMLFVFDNEMLRSFYMKNTRIPLDIIYINSDSSIVSIQEKTQPYNETSLPSILPARYVLELNAGLVEEWNIEVGDKIDFQRSK